jgi:hypothetical protein
VEPDEFEELIKRRQDLEFEERAKNMQLQAAALGGVGVLAPFVFDSDQVKEREQIINRAVESENYFDKDIDPRLKKIYLQKGGDGLQRFAGEVLKEFIPSTTSDFVPADLSLAGKYKEAVENITPIDYLTDNITVTPGPNPARFATPELTPPEIGEGGTKGYIWGNPDQPQWSYAQGNFNRNPGTTTNPTLYVTKLDLPPENKAPYRTTGEVIQDSTLIEKRPWGQNRVVGGDLYFPKESVKARGEVTAADLYTKIKNYGFDPGPIIDVKRPDLYFEKLAQQLATIEGTPLRQTLENIAIPVPALGISERARGAIPVFKEFDLVNTPLEQKIKTGINKIFLDPTHSDFEFANAFNPVFVNRNTVDLAVPPALHSPVSDVGRSFINRSPLRSGGAIAATLYSPEIFEEIEKKRYGSALGRVGVAATTGAVIESLIKKGVVNAAKAGIALPARALAVASPVGAAISMATMAPGSSRITPRQEAYENQLRETKFKQAEAARKRGGKWSFPTPFGRMTIPELGLSESRGLYYR